MKEMTCNQLGGACDLVFRAATFDEMADQSRQHGMQMHQEQDAPHLEAMQKMQDLMKEPDAMNNGFEAKRAEFDALPEVSD